jgi:hypothetical protein
MRHAGIRVAFVDIAAVVLTLASSAVPGTRIEVQDWDCPPPPASCARPVVAGGFPIPYLADYHAISPGGRVSLVDALMGIDKFRAGAFWTDVAFYTLVLGGAWALAARLAQPPRH